jgi:predicted transcriptional regulator
MNFDRLLEYLDTEAGQKEQVALIFYYFEQFEGENEITQSDVRELIRDSRSLINTSSVSTYFGRLENEDDITTAGNDGYRLTHEGEDRIEELLDEDALDEHRDEGDLFIDTDAIDHERYQELIEDINDCYRYRVYSGTMVLTRKLFEDIVFEILKTHYGGDDVQMYYHQEDDRHYSFNELLNNLKEGVQTLRRYSRELDEAFVERIRELKNAGNRGAHSIRISFTDDEMEEWSNDVTRIAEVLYDVLEGARIANESDN